MSTMREQMDQLVHEHCSSSAASITMALLAGVALVFASGSAADDTSRAADPLPRTAAVRPMATLPSLPSAERGRYLVQITGCNDCHTAGYAEGGGTLAASEWLMGTAVGFKGPWGVSYPANLRLTVHSMTEEQWLRFARVERLPPMPWFALRDMSDDDLRAMYRFIRSLGAKGTRAPAPVAPGRPVTTPFIMFEPQALATSADDHS